MTHVRAITSRRCPAKGETTLIETLIITVMSILFRDWDNFPAVIQSLSQFYAKTPG